MVAKDWRQQLQIKKYRQMAGFLFCFYFLLTNVTIVLQSSIMDPDLKDYILYLIQTSFVHSVAIEGRTAYVIGQSISDYDFLLTTKYSHSTPNDIWCEYELFSHVFPVYRITLSLNQQIQQDDTLAQDFLTILKKCSNKVKLQERNAQKNMFLRTFVNNTKELEY